MKLLYCFLAWGVMGSILGYGIYMAAVKSSPWILIVSLIGFVVAVGKIGCATH